MIFNFLFQTDIGRSSLKQHFAEVIASAPLDVTGPMNVYHAPAFISSISKYFLPHATLWSGMLLGMSCFGESTLICSYSSALLIKNSVFLQETLDGMGKAQRTAFSVNCTIMCRS